MKRWQGSLLSPNMFTRHIAMVAVLVILPTAVFAQPRDEFYWLGEVNKASAVMVVEQGIVPPDLGRQIAAALTKVIAEGNKPGAMRPNDYLPVEKSLIAVGGPTSRPTSSDRRNPQPKSMAIMAWSLLCRSPSPSMLFSRVGHLSS